MGQSIYSRYFLIESLNLDYGPIFSTLGYNDVEGLRVRAGGRTFKTANDLFRIEGYGAYGFKDQKIKYGIQAKWLLNKKNRFTITAGHRNDVEQIGTSLTTTTNVLGQSDGSSSLVGTGTNDKLTKLNLTSFTIGIEPKPNLEFNLSAKYKTLESASNTFSLDYIDSDSETGIASQTNQFETVISVGLYPGRKMSGYGVHREVANPYYTQFYTQITKGLKNTFNSDFDYTKIQFSFFRLWKIGGLGRLKTSLETGKTYGAVPLSLLSVAPGNQTYFIYDNTFNLLDFYEFVSDTYASFHLEHNFNGRIFSRIPLLKKANLRTIIGFKTFWGSLSEQNKVLNTTGNNFEIPLVAPNKEPYYEYSLGISNIFKILRVDFNFRGNYLENPDVRNFGITAGLRFNF